MEQLFDEYQKVIPELMIEDKFRLLKQIEKKDEKINKLSQKDKAFLCSNMPYLRYKTNC